MHMCDDMVKTSNLFDSLEHGHNCKKVISQQKIRQSVITMAFLYFSWESKNAVQSYYTTQKSQSRIRKAFSGVPYLHFSDHAPVFDILEATSFSSFFSSISLHKALSGQFCYKTQRRHFVIDQAIISKVFSTGLSTIGTLREMATLHSLAYQGGP
uniref:Uncharacterized protein n=1 Tax=Glossina pallidipes TaxID=7398 RepID=A0A1A9ZNI7_GLOPL